MAEPRPTPGRFQVHVDYLFDRLHDSKLAQAYSILVPVRERPVGGHLPFGHGFERNGDISTVDPQALPKSRLCAAIAASRVSCCPERLAGSCSVKSSTNWSSNSRDFLPFRHKHLAEMDFLGVESRR